MAPGDAAQSDVERLAYEAAADPESLTALLAAAGPGRIDQSIRERSAAALKLLAVREPPLILGRWDALASMLHCDNAYSKMIATHLIALLAPADDAGRLAAILDSLYDNMGDKVSVAGHVIAVSPDIARARPELKCRITARILDLPRIAKPDRLGLLRSYAIEAFDAYLEPEERTGAVVGFVRAGLADDSPKTRKLAAEVLRRWGVA